MAVRALHRRAPAPVVPVGAPLLAAPPGPSAAEYAERRARLLRSLDAPPHVGAALVFGAGLSSRNGDSEYRFRQGSDLHYLCGWEDPDVAALLRPEADQPFVLFVQPRQPDQELWTGRREGVEGARERYGADAAFPYEELAARLPELCQGYRRLHYAFGDDAERDRTVFAALRKAGRGAARNGLEAPTELHRPEPLLAEQRLVKAAAEIALLRHAGAITAEAHLAGMRAGRPGAYEYEVEAAIDHVFRRRGGEGPGYTTIVGGGNNATVMHYCRNRDVLRDGDLCLVDAGGEYALYTADVTRTWPVSGRFSGPQRDLYELVLAAQLAAIEQARAGVPYRRMHDAALRVLVAGLVDLDLLDGDVDELIADEAYKPYYPHGTGHWLGLDVHDPGAYHVDGRSRPLAPGHVVTVEPGLYVPADDPRAPDAFRGIGIRIEDDVLVTDGEPDVLTAACPKEIADVEAACRRG